MMLAKRIVMGLLAGMLVLLPASDSIACSTGIGGPVKSCGCTPCNSGKRCPAPCRAKVSSQSPKLLSRARAPLTKPITASGRQHPRTNDDLVPSPFNFTSEAEQHPPPELYTRYLSLLI